MHPHVHLDGASILIEGVVILFWLTIISVAAIWLKGSFVGKFLGFVK